MLSLVLGVCVFVASARINAEEYQSVPREEESATQSGTGRSPARSQYANVDLASIYENAIAADGSVVTDFDGGRRRLLTHPFHDHQCICDWCEEHCPACEHECPGEEWTCGQHIEICGWSRDRDWICVCDVDVEGRPSCWQDDYCVRRPNCYTSSDCLPSETCVTTCCQQRKCFKKCEDPFCPHPSTTRPCPEFCDFIEDWSCGQTYQNCGSSTYGNWECICDEDIRGDKVCWQNDACFNLQTCYAPGHCPVGYSCVPNTCCGVPKCIKDCEVPLTP